MVNPASPTNPANYDRETLLRNKEDRECAENTMELLLTQGPKQGTSPRLRYWECLQERIAVQIRKMGGNAVVGVQPKVDTSAMTDEEAQHFQNTERFTKSRKFPNKLVTEVPTWYVLFWLRRDKFSADLERYARSRLFQRRQDEEENFDRGWDEEDEAEQEDYDG